VRPHHLRTLRLMFDKVIHLRDRPVEHRNVVPMVVHVQDQILSHDRQSNQPNIASSFSHLNHHFGTLTVPLSLGIFAFAAPRMSLETGNGISIISQR
jgi:hypothetical protein